MKKKIGITGAHGFLGRHICPLLKAKGYDVYPLKIDLTRPSFISAQIHEIQPEFLLHLAWETTPGIFWHTPKNLDWVKASLDLCQSFVLAGGKRVIIAGSCAEENHTTLYGASKEGLRILAQGLFEEAGVSFAWGRIYSPYGPHEKIERLIPSLILTLMKHKIFQCTSPNHLRDFMYVEDLAEAFVSLLMSPFNGTLDMGSGEPVKIGGLVARIAKKFGAENLIRFGSDSKSISINPKTLVADPKILFEEIKFKPKYSLETGIEKAIAWWKN